MTEKVLDHGYVKHIESWGSDERIIEAARMSTSKGFRGWGPYPCMICNGTGTGLTPSGGCYYCHECSGTGKKLGDEKLLRYLWTHKHATPFEMAGMIIEVQAPIFVFREWHRHRTQSYNELSARYTELPDLFYTPSLTRFRLSAQSKTNRQGSAQSSIPDDVLRTIQSMVKSSYEMSRKEYEAMLEAGIAREVARLVIPVAQYSRMRASANLRNWLAFLTLRMAENAQWEIRQYANTVGRLIERRFPRTWELFSE